jgi:hypothetical protein
MSPNNILLEDVLREYANTLKDLEQIEVLRLLLDYMNLLFEDSEEPVLLEDFTSYEGDDFMHFFLPDNYEGQELKTLQSLSIKVIKDFIQYCTKRKLVHKEALEEWKEVLK